MRITIKKLVVALALFAFMPTAQAHTEELTDVEVSMEFTDDRGAESYTMYVDDNAKCTGTESPLDCTLETIELGGHKLSMTSTANEYESQKSNGIVWNVTVPAPKLNALTIVTGNRVISIVVDENGAQSSSVKTK